LRNTKRLLIIMGIVAAIVVLVVVFDTILANHRPAIASLDAPERVVPSGSCQIVCDASDRDGDDLSYNWSASAGQLNGEGAAISWIAPNSVGVYNVTVAVTDGRGGEVMQQVVIIVRANRWPIITGLGAEENWTLPSGTIQLTCNATDPDGDQLTYEWMASVGDISGTGTVVNWTAPEAVGMYNITVVVRDSHDSSVTRTLPVTVATLQPPTIEQLLITKDRYGHCYLKKSGEEYLVGKEQMYDIECIVADVNSWVSYNWSCDGGEISGEGSMVTWIAPNTSTEVAVTVIVSDMAGNMASENMILNVVSCSRCTFGC
jgi:hypothetical protein